MSIVKIITQQCTICNCQCERDKVDDPVGSNVNCPNCGRYYYGADGGPVLLKCDPYQKARLSHEIWKAQLPNGNVQVTKEFIEVARSKHLPAPGESLDLLIAYLGKKLIEQPDKLEQYVTEHLQAKIGVSGEAGVHYIANAGHERKWLYYTNYPNDGFSNGACRITLDGWQRYNEILKGHVHSNRAFMAMQFGDPVSGEFFDKHLRPAVARTGLELERVDARHELGLIDDKIRVDIRNCKFLVADLSDNNRGVYWEAGFAEGIGKHVFYVCNCEKIDATKAHFDTNHQNIIQWEVGKEALAESLLVDSIRRYFPDVRQSDPDPS